MGLMGLKKLVNIDLWVLNVHGSKHGFQFERCTRTDVVLTYRAFFLWWWTLNPNVRAKMKNTALYFMLVLEVLRASAGDAIAQVHP